MDRLACVDIPSLPLQLLLRDHPDWKDHPVAVVAEDKPQALILWVNEKARRSNVLPGLRYANALSLTGDLRADVVTQTVIETNIQSLTKTLQRFSPEVEPAPEEPGVFWLNACGLERLFSSLEDWSASITGELSQQGFFSNIVVGFTRFGTYAVAKSSRRRRRIFDTAKEETETAYQVKLARIGVEPAFRESLDKLGIHTVLELLNLPAKGLLKRFGEEAYRLHRLAAGDLWTPLQPEPIRELTKQRIYLDSPEPDSERLLFLIKRILDALLARLQSRGEALHELVIQVSLDDGGDRKERIRTAAPTLDSAQILGLVRLRLESLELSSGVIELEIIAMGTQLEKDQHSLFLQKPRRDLAAASRAFARLRAEFGDDVVVRAELREGHLPRTLYRWEPMEKVTSPTPGAPKAPRSLVRRVYGRPIPLPPRSRREPDGWLLRGLEHGPMEKMVGPYIVSGGWWGLGVHREYHFIKMKQGEIYWAFYDRRRRQWFLEGRVE
jgi:protein ImuB